MDSFNAVHTWGTFFLQFTVLQKNTIFEKRFILDESIFNWRYSNIR